MLHRVLGGSFVAFAALLLALIIRRAGDSAEEKFWLEQTMFVNKVVKKVSRGLGGPIHGSKFFMQRVDGGVKVTARLYSYVSNRWEEAAVSRIVPECDVPPAILTNIPNAEEVEVTDMLEMQLKKIERKEP